MVQAVRHVKPVEEDRRTPAEKRAALKALFAKLDAQGRQPSAEEREFIVRTAMGSFADIMTSSEDFMRRKQLEIELEDRGWRPPDSDS